MPYRGVLKFAVPWLTRYGKEDISPESGLEMTWKAECFDNNNANVSLDVSSSFHLSTITSISPTSGCCSTHSNVPYIHRHPGPSSTANLTRYSPSEPPASLRHRFTRVYHSSHQRTSDIIEL
ncbi:hypothetical protein MRB53_041080 [Persea americana]|nr:hypothetical protein MRB53_041080 [Persea americana]